MRGCGGGRTVEFYRRVDAGGRRRLACRDDADRRVSLRSGPVRGRRRAAPRRRGQLLVVLRQGIPALDRAAFGLPADRGSARAVHLSLRNPQGTASLLPALRGRQLLRAALPPGRRRRERALPRWCRRGLAAPVAVRRTALGGSRRGAPEQATRGRVIDMSARAAFVLGFFIVLAALVHAGLYVPGHDFVM